MADQKTIWYKSGASSSEKYISENKLAANTNVGTNKFAALGRSRTSLVSEF
jgi:hypothetical protein